MIERIPKGILSIFGIISVLGLIIIVLGGLGSLARGEESVIPWRVFLDVSHNHGYLNGTYALANSIILFLWLFFVPGRLYSDHVRHKTNRLVLYPYVVNILIGLLLCSRDNIFYRLFL
jgi:hypothetical protein